MMLMKRYGRILLALLPAALLLAVSCNREDTGRRRGSQTGDNPQPGQPTSVFTENPDWTITYTGRGATAEADGTTFVVDILHVQSTDSKSWYLDLVSANDMLIKYQGSLDAFIQESVQNARNNGDIPVEKTSTDVVFDRLDDGGSNWVAVAYGCDAKGNLTGEFSRLGFTTQAITLKKDNTFRLRYDGRVTIQENGQDVEVEKIHVSTDSPYSYYVDIAYPEYITEYFEGDYAAYFNSVVDGIYAATGGEDIVNDIYYDPELTIEFDRFRSGPWTVYAFGVDAFGNLTGSWSELNFTVPEEKPTDAFNRWLGTWSIGDNHFSYPIVVSSSEANVAYRVSGWETGDAADPNSVQYTRDFAFETRFDKQTGNMVFYVQYVGFPYVSEGETLDVYLLGVYRKSGQQYVYELKNDIATAVLDESGTTGRVEANTVDDITFLSMQYCELSRNPESDYIGTFNSNLPFFPMQMTWVSSSTVYEGSASVARQLPVRRSALQTKAAGKQAASPYRKAGERPERKVHKAGSVRLSGR